MAKKTESIEDKTITFNIKYTIRLDKDTLETFITDELEQLRGYGSAEVESVIVNNE